MRRAFVTGATGGIGSVLCDRLSAAGWRVTALVRPGAEAAQIKTLDGVSLATGDLLDEASLTELMRGCDVVFHLAAMVHAPPNASLSQFQRINIDGTRSVVNAADAAGVPALVFFSTVAVYPESEESLDESSAVGPSTPYGATKLAAEQLVMTMENRMRVTILRLPVVYGPRDRGNVRRLAGAIAKRRFFIPGSGDNVKTMVAVDNVAEAALHVASDARASGRIYLVTDENPATLSEIVSVISRCLGLSRMPPKVPLALAVAAGQLADFLRALHVSLPISAADVRKLASSTRYDGGRIRRELGFRPPVELAKGIASAMAGYKLAEGGPGASGNR